MKFKSITIANRQLSKLASVVGTFSLDGSLKINAFFIDFDFFTKILKALNRDSLAIYFYKKPRFPKKTFITEIKFKHNFTEIKVSNLKEISEAEQLIGSEIYIDKFWYEEKLKTYNSPYALLNFTVTFKTQNIGQIQDILLGEFQTLLSVISNKKEILIPFVDEYIENIDYDKKNIEVNLPEGFI